MLLRSTIVSFPDESRVGFEALVVGRTAWQHNRLPPSPRRSGRSLPPPGARQVPTCHLADRRSACRSTSPETGGDAGIHLVDASSGDPQRLTLEITEQTAVEDLERAGAVLQPLRSLGVHVALDDFGTGFSSLGYLAGLPVDELKIDRRFVSGIGLRQKDDALVRAVIGLAADLGLRVVAEGVESREQVLALTSWGCSLAQGYHFHRPMPMVPIPSPRPVPGSTGPLPSEQHGPLVVESPPEPPAPWWPLSVAPWPTVPG